MPTTALSLTHTRNTLQPIKTTAIRTSIHSESSIQGERNEMDETEDEELRYLSAIPGIGELDDLEIFGSKTITGPSPGVIDSGPSKLRGPQWIPHVPGAALTTTTITPGQQTVKPIVVAIPCPAQQTSMFGCGFGMALSELSKKMCVISQRLWSCGKEQLYDHPSPKGRNSLCQQPSQRRPSPRLNSQERQRMRENDNSEDDNDNNDDYDGDENNNDDNDDDDDNDECTALLQRPFESKATRCMEWLLKPATVIADNISFDKSSATVRVVESPSETIQKGQMSTVSTPHPVSSMVRTNDGVHDVHGNTLPNGSLDSINTMVTNVPSHGINDSGDGNGDYENDIAYLPISFVDFDKVATIQDQFNYMRCPRLDQPTVVATPTLTPASKPISPLVRFLSVPNSRPRGPHNQSSNSSNSSSSTICALEDHSTTATAPFTNNNQCGSNIIVNDGFIDADRTLYPSSEQPQQQQQRRGRRRPRNILQGHRFGRGFHRARERVKAGLAAFPLLFSTRNIPSTRHSSFHF
ncbi:hypothetical protein BGZ94_001020 [Podila epigama]|nr:hypothetical protein BGZ94_001020 [Podila epigama]